MKDGDWYNAQQIENTVEGLTETAGLLGYAFADVRPQFERDKEKREMNVTFQIGEAPRVYVERVQINGNTTTLDTVIRREFRLAEGDAFNSIKVKRSRDRLLGLGFFQDKLEIEQKPGSAPDKVILEANVQEKPTGELQVSAGFSSLERFILSLSIRQRNFRGRGQELRASANVSSFSKSIEAGFTEPYLFGRNLALGFDVFRRDFRSFNFTSNNTRNTTYNQVSTGFQVRTGFPITEFWAASLRYGLSFENITLDEATFFTNGSCDPLLAGRYLCEAIGKRTISSIGYSIIFNNVNNPRRPSAGQRFSVSQDLAGIPIGVKYLRTRVNYDWYYALFGSGFVLNVGGEAGLYHRLWWPGRVADRSFLPRPAADAWLQYSRRRPARAAPAVRCKRRADHGAQPGLGRCSRRQGLLSCPRRNPGCRLGRAVKNWGCGRRSSPMSVLCGTSGRRSCNASMVRPQTAPNARRSTASPRASRRSISAIRRQPRLSVGVGVSWNSPFGPFRFDLAKALLKQPGDDTQLFQFNVGTQF